MKKMISLILALVMVLSLSVTAFASEITQPTNNSQNVTGTYVAGEEAQTIYSVDISWGDMKFTYTGASADVWNPGDHSTTPGAAAAWTVDTEGGNQVTVTNHSNAAIAATVTYKSLDAYSAITGTVTNGDINLDSAVGTEYDAAPNGTASLTLAGELPSDHTAGNQIGTITVAIGGGQTSPEEEPITLTFNVTPSGAVNYSVVSVTFKDAGGAEIDTQTNPNIGSAYTATVPEGAVTFSYIYTMTGTPDTGVEFNVSDVTAPTVSSSINTSESTTTPNA